MFGRDENVGGHEEERGGVKGEMCVLVWVKISSSQMKECTRSVLVFDDDCSVSPYTMRWIHLVFRLRFASSLYT